MFSILKNMVINYCRRYHLMTTKMTWLLFFTFGVNTSTNIDNNLHCGLAHITFQKVILHNQSFRVCSQIMAMIVVVLPNLEDIKYVKRNDVRLKTDRSEEFNKIPSVVVPSKRKSGKPLHFTRRKVEGLSTKMERLQWRRNKVLELSSQGRSQPEIATILQVGLGTISRDIQYLREQARENLKTHI